MLQQPTNELPNQPIKTRIPNWPIRQAGLQLTGEPAARLANATNRVIGQLGNRQGLATAKASSPTDCLTGQPTSPTANLPKTVTVTSSPEREEHLNYQVTRKRRKDLRRAIRDSMNDANFKTPASHPQDESKGGGLILGELIHLLAITITPPRRRQDASKTFPRRSKTAPRHLQATPKTRPREVD